jgi:hypothetical protein
VAQKKSKADDRKWNSALIISSAKEYILEI